MGRLLHTIGRVCLSAHELGKPGSAQDQHHRKLLLPGKKP